MRPATIIVAGLSRFQRLPMDDLSPNLLLLFSLPLNILQPQNPLNIAFRRQQLQHFRSLLLLLRVEFFILRLQLGILLLQHFNAEQLFQTLTIKILFGSLTQHNLASVLLIKYRLLFC